MPVPFSKRVNPIRIGLVSLSLLSAHLGYFSDAKVLSASVGPITENPIPSWGNPASDLCTKIGSCDACQPDNTQYCFYKENGDANCCQGQGANSNNNDTDDSISNSGGLVASVGPITENPIPSWSSSNDSCSIVGSCDSCQPQGNIYCFYKENGDANCCTGNNPNKDNEQSGDDNNEEKNPSTLVASVGPITENPIPSWASSSDSCAFVGSCDACQPEGPQYCFYANNGQANCCQGTPSNESKNEDESKDSSSSLSASVTPITEDPIPSWASPSDKCTRKRSCDVCVASGSSVYCKYTDSGIPQCCTGAGAPETVNMVVAEQEENQN